MNQTAPIHKTYIETENKRVNIPRPETTGAQEICKIGYYSYEVMNFEVECADVWDLTKCVKIIEDYNRFDDNTVNIAIHKHFGLSKFWYEGNPNNGNDLLRFTIAREYSPAIYVTFSHYNRAGGEIVKILTDTEGQEGGTRLVYTEEYHVNEFAEEFKRRCKQFGIDAKCDEVDEQQDTNVDGLRVIKYRFWWD